jgi:hypothetical protein
MAPTKTTEVVVRKAVKGTVTKTVTVTTVTTTTTTVAKAAPAKKAPKKKAPLHKKAPVINCYVAMPFSFMGCRCNHCR